MSAADLSDELVRVLAVDDQPPFRAAAREVVDATAGFTWAGEARSGAEGVELVLASEPDIVIMDVRMPDMDGIEAARRVMAARPEVAVLLVSAEPLASPGDLLRSRAVAFSRKHEFGPALLRLIKRRRQPGAAVGTQP